MDYYFIVFFESWTDKRNKVKIKISYDNISIKGGCLVIFNNILKRDDVLDAIDYSKRVVLCCIGRHPMRFELKFHSQNDGFFYFSFRREIESDS